MDKVKNEEILDGVKEGTIIRKIQRRKDICLGNVLGGSGILIVAVEGSVNGMVKKGRKMKLAAEVKVASYHAMKEMTGDNDGWRQ